MLTFTIPGQAVGKGRPRVTQRNGFARLYTPEKTASYEGLVAQIAQGAMAGHAPIEGPVTVRIDIRCAVPASWSNIKQRRALAGEVLPATKPDIDNAIKAVFDGMNGVVWRDDVQAVDVHARKRYASTPGVVVIVDPIASLVPVQTGLTT